MQGWWIERYGGPDVLRRDGLAEPVPGRGEVLVAVSHAGVNFMDIHTRQGKYRTSRTYPVALPCTLGMEGAGRVVATGADVGGLAAGDRVAWCLSWGSYAEYAVVPAWRLVPVPDALSLELAAASLFQGCTAHYLMHDVGRLGPGDSCLIQAASGAIGQLLVQMAKAAGVQVFATAGSPAKAAVVRSLGADHVLAYEQGRFADRILDETGGRGVDVVFDAIGRDTLRDSFRAARRRGLVVNYGSVSGGIGDLDPIELGEAGSLFLTRPRLADHLATAEQNRARAADVFAALGDGRLAVTIAERVTLDDIPRVHAALERRAVIGKPVLVLPRARTREPEPAAASHSRGQ